MGLFFPTDEDKLPPGRRRGFERYKQVLGRDFKEMYLVNLLTLASFLPFGLGAAYAVLSQSVLVLLTVCVLGGMIAGQGIAAMYDFILRRLRDMQADWWYCVKRSLRQNARAALLPGALEGLFLGCLIFTGALLWWSGRITPGTLFLLAAAAVLFTMLFSVWWPQVVLFDQRPLLQLRSCVLFCVRYFWRTLGAAVLQCAFWLVMFLFLPWTAFLVPVLGVWYILFVSNFLLYDQLDEAFRIEEQIAARFPEQIPDCREDERGNCGGI